MKQLGLEDVPIVDAKCSSSWIEAKNEIASGGYSYYINDDWVNNQVLWQITHFFSLRVTS